MTRNVLAKAALLLAGLAIAGCQVTLGVGPTPLIGALNSRMNAAGVRDALKVADMSWQARTERSAAAHGRPQYVITTVRVGSFSDLGMDGCLGLTFFNDQLMKAVFFPDDLGRYRSKLETENKLRLGPTNEARLPPQTRIWIGKALGAETRYIGWEDVALTEEYRNAIT